MKLTKYRLLNAIKITDSKRKAERLEMLGYEEVKEPVKETVKEVKKETKVVKKEEAKGE